MEGRKKRGGGGFLSQLLLFAGTYIVASAIGIPGLGVIFRTILNTFTDIGSYIGEEVYDYSMDVLGYSVEEGDDPSQILNDITEALPPQIAIHASEWYPEEGILQLGVAEGKGEWASQVIEQNIGMINEYNPFIEADEEVVSWTEDTWELPEAGVPLRDLDGMIF